MRLFLVFLCSPRPSSREIGSIPPFVAIDSGHLTGWCVLSAAVGGQRVYKVYPKNGRGTAERHLLPPKCGVYNPV